MHHDLSFNEKLSVSDAFAYNSRTPVVLHLFSQGVKVAPDLSQCSDTAEHRVCTGLTGLQLGTVSRLFSHHRLQRCSPPRSFSFLSLSSPPPLPQHGHVHSHRTVLTKPPERHNLSKAKTWSKRIDRKCTFAANRSTFRKATVSLVQTCVVAPPLAARRSWSVLPNRWKNLFFCHARFL